MAAVVSVCLDEMRGPPGWDQGVDERWTPERLRVGGTGADDREAMGVQARKILGCLPALVLPGGRPKEANKVSGSAAVRGTPRHGAGPPSVHF